MVNAPAPPPQIVVTLLLSWVASMTVLMDGMRDNEGWAATSPLKDLSTSVEWSSKTWRSIVGDDKMQVEGALRLDLSADLVS